MMGYDDELKVNGFTKYDVNSIVGVFTVGQEVFLKIVNMPNDLLKHY